jgi:type II restriction enzyme
MKGNKGEWSEMYALLKLLSEAKVNGATADLQIDESAAFRITQIVRGQGAARRTYCINPNGSISLSENLPEFAVVRSEDLKAGVRDVLQAISGAASTTFEVPKTNELMRALCCDQLKSASSDKDDITLVVHDGVSGRRTELPLSIKSMMGGAPTLLNAGKTTNWRYAVDGLSAASVHEINGIYSKSKVRDRVQKIRELGGNLRFEAMESTEFHRNLITLDASLPALMARALIIFYSGEANSMADISNRLAEAGIVIEGVRLSRDMIRFKFGTLLHNIALGMNPGTEWDFLQQAHGGYLVVRTDGEIVCYHVYNLDEFKTYLLDNTRFETASTGRHGFGELYEQGDGIKFRLNLQIRFS